MFCCLETCQRKSPPKMLEPLCALTVPFLHFFNISVNTLNFVNCPVMSGASSLFGFDLSLAAAVCHAVQ